MYMHHVVSDQHGVYIMGVFHEQLDQTLINGVEKLIKLEKTCD